MTHMPYLQMVRGKWRVRVPVPENLRPHMPPPHTGKATLTRALGTGNDREANRLGVPVIAEFLGLIAKTEGRVNGLSELATLNNVDLGNPQQIHHASAVMQRFLSTLNLPVPACEIPKEPVTFPDMIELWSRGQHKKAIGNTTAKCGRFIYFLGHDDMARVTFINGREWRDEMVNEDELAPGSIANHLKAVKALFNYTCDNYPERLTVNVLDRVKYSPGDGASRDDFTPDERREILTLARRAEPHIYWSNWICSFHGNRNGEIADMSTRDIEITPEGIAVFNITTLNRSKDQRLKTPVSTRKLSLHQAVLDEGFIEYRDGVSTTDNSHSL